MFEVYDVATVELMVKMPWFGTAGRPGIHRNLNRPTGWSTPQPPPTSAGLRQSVPAVKLCWCLSFGRDPTAADAS
jgi:hypothetical protein